MPAFWSNTVRCSFGPHSLSVKSQVDTLLDQIEADGDLVGALPLVKHLPDFEDEVFLAVALAGRAQCLVTGNLKHYPEQSRQGVRGVLPREFLELFRRSDAQDS